MNCRATASLCRHLLGLPPTALQQGGPWCILRCVRLYQFGCEDSGIVYMNLCYAIYVKGTISMWTRRTFCVCNLHFNEHIFRSRFVVVKSNSTHKFPCRFLESSSRPYVPTAYLFVLCSSRTMCNFASRYDEGTKYVCAVHFLYHRCTFVVATHT